MNLCSNECTSPTNWDYLVADFIKKNIKNVDNFLDLGSYKGLYLNFLLNLIPAVNITGIEMDIQNFNSLKIEYEPRGINLINLAISDTKGTIDYFHGCEGGCPNIFGQHENSSFVGPKIGTIETDTLDNLLPNHFFEFVKIDIEGAEIKALLGGLNFLKKSKVILIECHTESEFPEIMKILINDLNKDVYCLKYFHKKTFDSPFSYQIVVLDKKFTIENGIIKSI
jgi:FkbM family methyltransferase